MFGSARSVSIAAANGIADGGKSSTRGAPALNFESDDEFFAFRNARRSDSKRDLFGAITKTKNTKRNVRVVGGLKSI